MSATDLSMRIFAAASLRGDSAAFAVGHRYAKIHAMETMGAISPELDRPTSAEQDALRLLILLGAADGPVGDDAPTGAVAELRAESRLHALDFWLRNPDYLSLELLTQY